MKMYIIVTFLLLLTCTSFAQQRTPIQTYFASGITYNSQHGLGNPSTVGIAMTSGFEYPLSANFALFLGLDYQTFTVIKSGPDYLLEGSMNIIPATVGFMMIKDIDRINVYVKSGTGITIVSTPFATIDGDSNFISIQNDTRLSVLLQNGIGLEYKIAPTFIPYFEANLFHTLSKSDLMQNGLWSFPVLIGIKMQL